MSGLPRAAAPFVGFSMVLRANGFAVAPDQTVAFLQAVELPGPRDMRDVHRAALATLAPPPELREAFDALFRAHFLGWTLVAPAAGGDEEETTVLEPVPGAREIEEGAPCG